MRVKTTQDRDEQVASFPVDGDLSLSLVVEQVQVSINGSMGDRLVLINSVLSIDIHDVFF
jgi:hypothetical protein